MLIPKPPLEPDVITAVKTFFKTCILPTPLNQTNFVLTSKVPSPTEPTEFRTISCCNFLYKIISKVLVNRLKFYLTEVITIFQSAFITGRSIQNNIFVAYEAFHYLQSHRTANRMKCDLKVDMQKAYDQVE